MSLALPHHGAGEDLAAEALAEDLTTEHREELGQLSAGAWVCPARAARCGGALPRECHRRRVEHPRLRRQVARELNPALVGFRGC